MNRANTNIGVDRPNATGVSQSLSNPTTAEWFNTAAFTLQPLYTFGNVGTKLGYRSSRFLLGLFHAQGIPFAESRVTSVQFRWEAFNVLNHPAWGLPNTNLIESAVRSDYVYEREYAANAVCSQVRFLKYRLVFV